MGFLLRIVAGLSGLALVLAVSSVQIGRWQNPTPHWIAAVSSRARLNTYVITRMNPDGSERVELATVRDLALPPVWSPDGTRLAMVLGDEWRALHTMDAAGRDVRRVSPYVGELQSVAWSPDGEWLAYVARTAPVPGEAPHIYRVPARGGEPEQLVGALFAAAPGTLTYRALTWSPDGRWLAFSVEGDIDPALQGVYRLDVDGGTPERLVAGCCPSWSPAGDWLAFLTEGEGGARGLARVTPDGARVERLTDGLNVGPGIVWSPDGEWLAFFAFDTANAWTLYRMRADGEELRVLAAEVVQPPASWSPDGEWLAFAMLARNPFSFEPAIYRAHVASGALQPVTTSQEGVYFFPAWSPGAALPLRIGLLYLAGLALIALALAARLSALLEPPLPAGWEGYPDP